MHKMNTQNVSRVLRSLPDDRAYICADNAKFYFFADDQAAKMLQYVQMAAMTGRAVAF